MTTSEKLILQIFEMKNRVIEQVKQQTELYNRHLASKAILHGHTPPSWLFNPSNSTSRELSKEDLISELLPPGPRSRPPVRYSVAGSSQYSKPFITESREVANGFGPEPHASNKDVLDVVEGPSMIVEGNECIAQNTSNYIPELDISSPVDFVDVRISNIYTAPDQSLARIQRSKSRQRAIEQRNSATSQAKSNLGSERTPRASSSGNILFALDCEQAGHANSSNILSESCAISGAKQSTCYLSNENDIGACSNEIKSTSLDPEQVHSVNDPPRSAERLSISSESCRVKRKNETDIEKSGEGYNDHAGPVAICKRSGNSRSLEKKTLKNSEVGDEESNIFNKGSIPSQNIVEIDGDLVCSKGDSRSNEKGTIANAESTSSKSSGKSCEDTASKKEERGIEEKCNSATSQAKINSGNDHTCTASSSGNILFALDYEQAGHINSSSILSEPCAISGAKQSTCYLSNENYIGACSNEIKLSSLDPEQVRSVNEPSRSAEPLSISSEGFGFKGISETDNEKAGDGYNDHAGPVAISKGSGNSHSLEKTPPRNSEVEDKESNIFNKGSMTSHDIIEIDGDIGCCKGDGRSNEKDSNAHAESTSSRSSGKGCEQTASKKDGSGIEEKGSDAHVEKSSTPKKYAQHENHLSGCMEENYYSEYIPGKDIDNITSCNIVDDGHIECSKGDGQSNDNGLNAHAESSTSSECSGKSCEDTASKKDESEIEEKGSDAHVEKSSTPKKSAQHENHLSDSMGENYYSERVPGKDIDKITSSKDPESLNNQICSFDGLLKQTCFENRPGNWIVPPNAGQGVSGVRESDLEDGLPQNDNAPNFVGLASLKKASLPDEDLCLQMMDGGTTEDLHCDSAQQLDDNQVSVVVRELNRSVHKRSEDSPLIMQTSEATSNLDSAGHTFAQFQGSAGEKPIYKNSLFQRAEGDHVMLPCLDMCDKAEQPETVNKIEAIEAGSEKLAEIFHVSEEDEWREKSLENSCRPFLDAAVGVPSNSFTTNKAGDSGVQMTKSEPRRSWHFELEARQTNGEHPPSNEAVSTQSNPSNTIYDSKFSHEQGCEFSTELLVEEEKCYSTENYENRVNHSQKNSEASTHLRWTEEAAKSTSEGLFVSMSPSYLNSVYATNHEDEQISEIKSDVIEKLSCAERISSKGRLSPQVVGDQPQDSGQSLSNKDLEFMINDWRNLPESVIEEGHSKRKLVTGEDGIVTHSVRSPHIEEVCAIDADRSHPELESFVIDSQSENDTPDFPGDMSNFDDLELPKSTIARVSMLERLCKSASSYTPLSYLSSTFKMDKVTDLFHSIPNGLLEHADLEGVQLRDDVKECQVSLSMSSEAEGGLQEVSHTNSLPCSGAPKIGLSSVNGFSSPEGRYWEGYSSRSSSSGKRLSSKPEFECFTIQEDPCSSEGNEPSDEDSDKLPKDVDSLTVNCHATDSDKFQKDSDSLIGHCAAREPSTGAHKKFKSFLRSTHKKKETGRDTQTPLASGKRTAKESLNSRYKKLKTSEKSSLRNEHLDSARKTYGTNIVSNVTSFIPLIQQKQAAAKACAGKREIKVKALEAAEAAKRLAEKRENERKSKKEALKKERARMMEQEKAKQIELIKKKREDEQRRKDAEMVLRKRLREEEERKEERKRARTEETRQKQRDQEEKLHAKKVGNMDSKKKSNHDMKLSQTKKPGGDNVKLDNESRSAAISSSDIQQASTCPKECSYSADLCDNKQANCTPDSAKTSYFVGDNIQEKSYEISPYQGSDDEDDELHTKKFIPSWASKNLVAESLFLMLDVDPNVIFPPESRCSMDEVLLPRKLQQGQSML